MNFPTNLPELIGWLETRTVWVKSSGTCHRRPKFHDAPNCRASGNAQKLIPKPFRWVDDRDIERCSYCAREVEWPDTQKKSLRQLLEEGAIDNQQPESP